MARLHEYQGKELLKQFKIPVPKGGVARTPDEARRIAEEIGGEVMVKAQAWVTGRAGLGGIKKASNPAQAEEAAQHMLGLKIKNFTVEQVLVEQKLEIAREYDRPPTPLEKIAYNAEANDYRGTFYFIQMAEGFQRGDGYVGFHGAGGGGSMMSMDAIMRQGYKLATFVDTSGNPPASKVYRAAKIVLATGPIDGYFGSGSGVASQEQFHSARGFVKAFLEAQIDVPVVIRLGGNAEDRAVEILEWLNGCVPAPVEGYKKDDPPDFCAQRLDALIKEARQVAPKERPEPARVGEPRLYQFGTVTGGTITYDHSICAVCESKVCVKECARQILSLNEEGLPELNISREEAQKGRCVECLACEVDCTFLGAGGGKIELPIPGLDEYLEAIKE
jgi:ferredoxin-like protein FixX